MTHQLHPSPDTQGTQPIGTRRRQVIASLFGERSFEFVDWRRLMQDGCLVRLRIGRCRFTTRLELEDLGIQIEDAVVREKLSKWLMIGEKKLLPESYMKALAHIESSARYALKERAFRTELGAFIPYTAYVTWRDTTESLREQYMELRDRILANHRELVNEVISNYEVIAHDTYQRLSTNRPDLSTTSEAEFVVNYCNRIASQIPSPDRIRQTFDFKYTLVDGLSQLGTTESFTDQEVEIQDAQERISRVRTQAQEQEWQRSVLESDLRRHAQERVNTALDSFLSSVVGQLRNLTYEAVCDVLATLERRGTSFSPRSVVQLNNLLTQVRALNFYGDADIERMMEQVQQIVELTPAERQHSLADIGRTLRAIATLTRSTLLDLDEEPRSARSLSISDFPTETSVRQARAELGLELDVTQFANLVQIQADVRAERAEMAHSNGMESLWDVEGSEQRASRLV